MGTKGWFPQQEEVSTNGSKQTSVPVSVMFRAFINRLKRWILRCQASLQEKKGRNQSWSNAGYWVANKMTDKRKFTVDKKIEVHIGEKRNLNLSVMVEKSKEFRNTQERNTTPPHSFCYSVNPWFVDINSVCHLGRPSQKSMQQNWKWLGEGKLKMNKGKRTNSMQKISMYSKDTSVSFQRDIAQGRNNKWLLKNCL